MNRTAPTLNDGQQAAADGFFQFLLSDAKELIISGPGGVGKTFLMGYLIDEILPRYAHTCQLMGIDPRYDSVEMTATTNKAAEVLSNSTRRPTSTIHSFLNLRVQDDYKTGKSLLTKTNKWKVHQNKVIFVDEASMIDYPLLTKIREGTHDCKIVYVGDHCQLAPVMEPISPIYRQKLPFYELTEPMRNCGQPALMRICQQLRNTVETGIFNPIQTEPGVIDLLDDAAMEAEVARHFTNETDSRILAYTNKRVVAYNHHIRTLRQHTDTYTVGERLISNGAYSFSNGALSVEEEVEIVELNDKTSMVEIEPGVELEIRSATLRTKYGGMFYGIPLPEDRDHHAALVKYYGREKDWTLYFHLKNTFPDLRPRDAATVHKAQGSTYETVFIDLANISTCHNPVQAARMLYVAFTRARSRVFLYGKLADKYGGVIQ